MGSVKEEGCCPDSGGESQAMVHRGPCVRCRSSDAYDDERGGILIGRQAVQG